MRPAQAPIRISTMHLSLIKRAPICPKISHPFQRNFGTRFRQDFNGISVRFQDFRGISVRFQDFNGTSGFHGDFRGISSEVCDISRSGGPLGDFAFLSGFVLRMNAQHIRASCALT